MVIGLVKLLGVSVSFKKLLSYCHFHFFSPSAVQIQWKHLIASFVVVVELNFLKRKVVWVKVDNAPLDGFYSLHS